MSPHLVLDPVPEIRRSVKVATVAEMMECDVTDIRRLINSGELQAHGKGKRGLRVFLDSVVAYQQRHTKAPKDKAVLRLKRSRSRASLAAQDAAVARLKAKGLL